MEPISPNFQSSRAPQQDSHRGGAFGCVPRARGDPDPGRQRGDARRTISTPTSCFGFLNFFSGGGLSNLSVVMLGVGPYITSTIVMQLLTIIFPKHEGDVLRRRRARPGEVQPVFAPAHGAVRVRAGVRIFDACLSRRASSRGRIRSTLIAQRHRDHLRFDDRALAWRTDHRSRKWATAFRSSSWPVSSRVCRRASASRSHRTRRRLLAGLHRIRRRRHCCSSPASCI